MTQEAHGVRFRIAGPIALHHHPFEHAKRFRNKTMNFYLRVERFVVLTSFTTLFWAILNTAYFA